MKNWMFKFNLKIKTLTLIREGKAQMVEMEVAKTKTQVVSHVIEDVLFNLPVDKESDVVASEDDMHHPTLNSMLTNLG